MTIDVRGWAIDEFRHATRRGVSVADIVRATMRALADLPCSVLIGEPLTERAEADAARLDGVDPGSLPLYGVPFVVKDNIDVAGSPTTAGCPGFGATANHDATLVDRLRRAGAIVVGKANMDQFATGLVGTRSPYGTPPNALRNELVPGGSSSGSAIAVALGAVPFSIGTDTAGSGRVPAALNGIIGLKPTLGSVSIAGIVPAVRRFDCPSVFARSTSDARDVLDVIAALDPADAFSRAAPPTRPMVWPPVIGVPESWPSSVPVDAEMIAWFEAAVRRLTELGARVVPVDIAPLLELGEMLYGSSLVAERTASIGDAIAAGIDGLDPVVASIVSGGHRHTAVDAYRNEYRLAERKAAAQRLWDHVDVLAIPTTPKLVTLEDVARDPIGTNQDLGRLTSFANLADTACVVVPMEPRVPAGLQLVAPAWHDHSLLAIAQGYEEAALPCAPDSCTIVVVGAHLDGLALNHQLTSRRAWLRQRTTTAPVYRLFALPGSVPPKPGLLRVAEGGASIDVEVWSIGLAEFGSFVSEVPSPLCIGSVELADHTVRHGFLCEPWALVGARDITDFGGWRAYLRDGGPTDG